MHSSLLSTEHVNDLNTLLFFLPHLYRSTYIYNHTQTSLHISTYKHRHICVYIHILAPYCIRSCINYVILERERSKVDVCVGLYTHKVLINYIVYILFKIYILCSYKLGIFTGIWFNWICSHGKNPLVEFKHF